MRERWQQCGLTGGGGSSGHSGLLHPQVRFSSHGCGVGGTTDETSSGNVSPSPRHLRDGGPGQLPQVAGPGRPCQGSRAPEGIFGSAGGCVGSCGSHRRVGEDTSGKFLLGLLKAGTCAAVQGVDLQAEGRDVSDRSGTVTPRPAAPAFPSQLPPPFRCPLAQNPPSSLALPSRMFHPGPGDTGSPAPGPSPAATSQRPARRCP